MGSEKWGETDSDDSDDLGAFGIGADRFGLESCGIGMSRKPAGVDARATVCILPSDGYRWLPLASVGVIWRFGEVCSHMCILLPDFYFSEHLPIHLPLQAVPPSQALQSLTILAF